MITTRVVASVAAIGVVAVFTACSSTDPAPTDDTSTAPEVASSSTSQEKPVPIASSRFVPASTSFPDVIIDAGGSCTKSGATDFTCTLNGTEYQVGSDWKASAKLRAKACDEGFINPDYQVVTDGKWWISADLHDTYPALVTMLGKQGIKARTVSYCKG